MKQKSNALRCLMEFHTDVVKMFGWSLKTIRFDSDTIILDRHVRSWASSIGCQVKVSPPYHHAANGVAERNAATLVTTARCLAIAAGKFFRSDDAHYYFSMAVYLLNRTCNKRTGTKTPIELVTGEVPYVGHVVPVGAKGYCLRYPEERVQGDKLQPRAEECFLLGYPTDTQDAYIVRVNGRDVVRRDVVFHEFPANDLVFLESMDIISRIDLDEATLNGLVPSGEGQLPLDIELFEPGGPSLSDADAPADDGKEAPSIDPASAGDSDSDGEPAAEVHHIQLSSVRVPKNEVEAFDPLFPMSERWIEAVYIEMNEIIARGIIRELADGEASSKKPVPLRFVFKAKHDPADPDGWIAKARLVLQGFRQQNGSDYHIIACPTIGFSIVLVILHIAGTLRYALVTVDIGNAFLEAGFDTQMYVFLPRVYTGGRTIVGQLLGNLYGSKQGPRLWFDLLVSVLLDFGLEQGKCDPCYFYLDYYRSTELSQRLLVCVYVDDLIITGNDQSLIDELLAHLKSTFKKVKCNSSSSFRFLGLEVARREDGCFELKQAEYIEELMRRFDVAPEDRSVILPGSWQNLVNRDSSDKCSIHELLGSIRFAADRTCPQVACAASLLARYATKATEVHRQLCHHVLQYLWTHRHTPMVIGSPSREPIVLHAHCDASFDSSGKNNSQIGFVCHLSTDSGCISIKSMKAKNVCLSTTDAEIHGAVECTKQVIWLKELLNDLGHLQSIVSVRCDNKAVLSLASDPAVSEKRSRYLVVKIRFLQEQEAMGSILFSYVPSDSNPSDILTKIQSSPKLVQSHSACILGGLQSLST
jgi:hypothetical protein